MLLFVFSFHQGDTLDYLGIPGLHLAGSQGVIVIAICQAILMVTYDKQSYFCLLIFSLSYLLGTLINGMDGLGSVTL